MIRYDVCSKNNLYSPYVERVHRAPPVHSAVNEVMKTETSSTCHSHYKSHISYV